MMIPRLGEPLGPCLMKHEPGLPPRLPAAACLSACVSLLALWAHVPSRFEAAASSTLS